MHFWVFGMEVTYRGLWQWMMNPNRELTLKGEGINKKQRKDKKK
jgi:hypothetical protein